MSGTPPVAGSQFTSDWLTLREAVDHRSRAHGLTGFAADHLRRTTAGRPASVVDLGAGRGSNLRYLAPRLDRPVAWRLLDQDAALLDTAIRTTALAGADARRLSTEIVDLAAPLAPMLAGADLVSASALIDLVSPEWIQAFADACAQTGAAVLVTLSIDGRIQFTDREVDDDRVRRILARDQLRNKGLGVALGAAAPAALVNALARCGYAVTAQPSDWQLGPADAALAHALIDGWHEAAARQAPDQADRIDRWAERRAADVRDGRSRLTVGHVDVLGLPGRRAT